MALLPDVNDVFDFVARLRMEANLKQGQKFEENRESIVARRIASIQAEFHEIKCAILSQWRRYPHMFARIGFSQDALHVYPCGKMPMLMVPTFLIPDHIYKQIINQLATPTGGHISHVQCEIQYT